MQAIQVKYLPATKSRGSRLKATCEGSSIVEERNYTINTEEQALELAFKLENKLNWNTKKFAIGRFENCFYFIITERNL